MHPFFLFRNRGLGGWATATSLSAAPRSAGSPAGRSERYAWDKDIPYRVDPDATGYQQERCRLDLYYPTDRPPFTTLVWFHGGGMVGGDRYVPGELREQGLAVASVDYRLSPRAKAPAYIEDAAAAVAWVIQNIERYGGSRSRIIVAGASAGGYLAMLVGLDRRLLRAHSVDADEIAGLASISGQAIDHFTVREERGLSHQQPTIGELAPLYHVRADAPPILLVTGDRNLELLGRYEENAYFWRMLKVVGHPDVDMHELEGCDHPAVEAPAHALLLKFVENIGGVEPSPGE